MPCTCVCAHWVTAALLHASEAPIPDQPGYHVCKGQGQHRDEPAVALCDGWRGTVALYVGALSARTVPIARMVGSKMRKGYTQPPGASVADASLVKVQMWQG